MSDSITGAGGPLIFGTEGDDELEGDEGGNALSGAGGNDTLDGRGGKDILLGGAGDDVLYGGEGDDVLYGGEGADVLDGGAGDDELYGGAGDDYLLGSEGDDVLYGGEGDDVLYGEGGADTFVFQPGHRNDTVKDFADGEDAIDLSGFTVISGFEDLSITADGSDAVIDLSAHGGGSIRLESVDVADLDAEDFTFYEPPTDAEVNAI